MKEAREILKDVLKHTKKTKNSLAKAIGLPRSQNLYDIENEKIKNISPELSEKITKAFPDINRDYLLTGEGEMLVIKDAPTVETKQEEIHNKIMDQP